MRALGLDVGTKTIGLALTDEAEVAAHPLGVLPRTGNVSDASAVAALCVTHGVTDVVVGSAHAEGLAADEHERVYSQYTHCDEARQNTGPVTCGAQCAV